MASYPLRHIMVSGLVRGEWERTSGTTPWCVWTALSYRLSFRLYGSIPGRWSAPVCPFCSVTYLLPPHTRSQGRAEWPRMAPKHAPKQKQQCGLAKSDKAIGCHPTMLFVFFFHNRIFVRLFWQLPCSLLTTSFPIAHVRCLALVPQTPSD